MQRKPNTLLIKELSPQISEINRLVRKTHRSPKEHWQLLRTTRKLLKDARIDEMFNDQDNRPFVEISIKGENIRGLLDSGASISCLGHDALETLHRCNIKWKEVKSAVKTASGQSQEIKGYADVDIQFKSQTHRVRLYIVPTLTQTLYLGIDFWVAFNIFPKIDEITPVKPIDLNKHILNKDQDTRLNKVIADFPSCVKEGLGKTDVITHNIDVGNSRPTKQRYYSVSPAVQKKMFDEVDRMIELGVIEESQSPWNSPVTMVSKANGKSRLCLDARQLNSLTVKDAYPTPLINGILSRLNETHYISSIDLKDAFWQVELNEESREKTAFTVPGRPLYHFTRMPFGLCNSGQTMCRLMDKVIPSAMREFIFVYIDDLLIVSENFDTHIERLQLVADSLRKANLTINVEKSKFCMRSIQYLGHIVGGGTIRPNPDRIRAISEFPRPITIRQLRSFLGMAGWYRRYIRNFSDIAAPITDLMKNSKQFTWTVEADEAFKILKDRLTTAPVLTHPDFTKPFYIQCDASILGVGGVLFQIINGEEHPIAYMSKKLNAAQRNYSVTELECLAAILCVREFRCYVEGMAFTVVTDHASLKWLMEKKNLSGRLARWSLELQQFNFKIEHRKGSENIVPDALSRAVEEIQVVGKPLDLKDVEFESESYKQLINQIENNQENLPDIQVCESRVYKRVEPRQGANDASTWRLWVPEGLQQRVIEEAHNPPSSSHGGGDKTLELIRRQYFWPGMVGHIREFIAKCSLCKESKAPNYTLRPPMGNPHIAERPFQHLYIDLLGPYPRSKAGNTVILIIVDQLSKFLWLKPLRKASAITIVRFIESEIFHFVGAPETILSDNGKQFISNDFRALLSRYGVRHINSATHAPQVNASERVNRSIIAAIRTYTDEDQTTWDVHISAIASALRNATHASTTQSPYFTVFGQHMVQHAAAYPLLRGLKAIASGEIDVLPPSDARGEINKKVRCQLQLAQERSRRTYNIRAKEVTFQPGQEVFRRSFAQSDAKKNFNAKLAKQWLPARILSKQGSCLYKIEDRQGKKIKVMYHAKDLRA